MEDVIEAIQYVNSEVEDIDDVEIALTSQMIEYNFSENNISIILGLEGANPVGTKISNLRHLYDLGIRLIQLTWNKRNMIADGIFETRSKGGLTSFGVEVVEEMNDLGIIIDLSHMSLYGVEDVLSISSRPVVFSHSNATSVCDHPRNISDSVVEELASRRGLIGIAFHPWYLRKKGERTSVDDVVAHIDHICEKVGDDFVGIGPDFINFAPELIHPVPIPDYPSGLDEARKLPTLTQALIKRGYDEDSIRKILGKNFLRVAREVWRA